MKDLSETFFELEKASQENKRKLIQEHIETMRSVDEMQILLSLKKVIEEPAIVYQNLCAHVKRARQEVLDLAFPNQKEEGIPPVAEYEDRL